MTTTRTALAALACCAALSAPAPAVDDNLMFERLEIHVTTLNGGLTNHEAHTHRVEELVLLLEGEVEMLLGEEWRRVSDGDLVFVASDVPHSPRNLEESPAVYFAIQGL